MPERLADILLHMFETRDRFQHAKFPAYYRWCRGPTHKQINRFISLGYDVVEYRGFFGHGYYNKIKVLDKINRIKATYLHRIHQFFLIHSTLYQLCLCCSQEDITGGPAVGCDFYSCSSDFLGTTPYLPSRISSTLSPLGLYNV